jgi:hypothetical protein
MQAAAVNKNTIINPETGVVLGETVMFSVRVTFLISG